MLNWKLQNAVSKTNGWHHSVFYIKSMVYAFFNLLFAYTLSSTGVLAITLHYSVNWTDTTAKILWFKQSLYLKISCAHNDFSATCQFKACPPKSWFLLSDQSSLIVIAFRLFPLISPCRPVIRLTSHLCIFSLIHVSFLPPKTTRSLSAFLFLPVIYFFSIDHRHFLSSLHSLLFKSFPFSPLPSPLPYTSISASISGACTADGGGPLSPLREQKVCPLPLRLCVMEHREIETEEREQMGGGHTGCLFYNITPDNTVVISTTM